MQRNAERTRKRILAAATEEFAALGIAGARVNRIAEVAGCNKAMLYAYFGNKDELFDAVFTASWTPTWRRSGSTRTISRRTPVVSSTTSRSIPGISGSPPGTGSSGRRGHRARGDARREQDRLARLRPGSAFRRRIPADFSPVELLSLIQSIATSWSTMNPEYGDAVPAERAHRRRTVVNAVERLLSRPAAQA